MLTVHQMPLKNQFLNRISSGYDKISYQNAPKPITTLDFSSDCMFVDYEKEGYNKPGTAFTGTKILNYSSIKPAVGLMHCARGFDSIIFNFEMETAKSNKFLQLFTSCRAFKKTTMKQMRSILIGLAILTISACGHSQIKTPDSVMIQFEEFKNKEKFIQDDRLFYPGIGDSSLRPILNEKINLAASDFMKLAKQGTVPDKDYQDIIKKGLDRFSELYLQLDTEDRERICHYFEELMDIVGLDSSGGHLNKFMYGFDPTEQLRQH